MCRHDDLFTDHRTKIDHRILYRVYIIGIKRINVRLKRSLKFCNMDLMFDSFVLNLRIKILKYDSNAIVYRNKFDRKFERLEKENVFHIPIVDFSGKRK